MGEGLEAMSGMTCGEAIHQFFAYLDRALDGEPLEDLEAHLRTCLDCCDRLEFSRQLDAFVRGRVKEPAIPAGLESRIRERLATAARADDEP